MAISTWDDLIRASLQSIGVLAAGEVPSAEDSAIGLEVLNGLVDSLTLEGLTIYQLTRTTWTITASDGSYTVGSGANVNIARPVPQNIQGVTFIDTAMDPDYEFPLRRMTTDEYQMVSMKALTSNYPQGWYYNPTYPTGTLDFYPVPTSSTLQGCIYALTALVAPTSGSDTISVPPGYGDFLENELALKLAIKFPNAIVSELLIREAADSKAAVKRANWRPEEMAFDAGWLVQRGRRYNIREG